VKGRSGEGSCRGCITTHGDLSVLQVKEEGNVRIRAPGPRAGTHAVRAGGGQLRQTTSAGSAFTRRTEAQPSSATKWLAGTSRAVGDGAAPARLGEGRRVFAGTRFSAVSGDPSTWRRPTPVAARRLSFEQGSPRYRSIRPAGRRARIRIRCGSGERVLIHAAAGGVDIAAISLAQGRRCGIHGTASPGKHRDSPS